MDKNHSSELIKKKVRWLTPNKICERVVDSNHSKSESDAMQRRRNFIYKLKLRHIYTIGCLLAELLYGMLPWS